jgi:hypothetical protein
VEWRCLRDDPPTGKNCVVLFPMITDIGILYSASNPHYARKSALAAGYTHWAEITPHPDEAAAEARCAEIRRLDGLAAGQPLAVPTPSRMYNGLVHFIFIIASTPSNHTVRGDWPDEPD